MEGRRRGQRRGMDGDIMERLTCARCGSDVGADEVACPECSAMLTTQGTVLVVPGGVTTGMPVLPQGNPGPTAAPMPEHTTCPYCQAPVAPGDPVCMKCVRELPSTRSDAGDALRTTLEPRASTLHLSFTTGSVSVQPGQEVTLGRDPRHTSASPRLAAFDNVSRTHATVGLTREGAAWLRDEGSANGTWADEEPVPAGEIRPLHDGSVIRLASNVRAGVRLYASASPAQAHRSAGADSQ
ncbi:MULTISPECIES: FHA domain-containing protein [unclassified Streptomyces]|uniref:FHA domain-containing protein n=2 Tax=Streptomyces TaxID=1883 RepID=UPI0018E04AEF